MEPVVGLELGPEHLAVPHLLELDPRVVEDHRDRVIPWRGIGRRVHGHLRRLLERHRVHVAALELAPHSDDLPVVERLRGDAVERGIPRRRGVVREEKRPAPVVQEPFGTAAALEQPERHPVGLEMVGLRVVHRDEQPWRAVPQPDARERG